MQDDQVACSRVELERVFSGSLGKTSLYSSACSTSRAKIHSLKGSEMPDQHLIKGFSGHFVQIDQWGQRHQVEYLFGELRGTAPDLSLGKHIGHLKVLSDNPSW